MEDHFVFGELHAVKRVGLFHAAEIALLGRFVAQRFLDGGMNEHGIGFERGPLLGVREQQMHEAADEVSRRLVAGGEDGVARGEQLIAGKAFAAFLGEREGGDEIVLGLRAAGVDQGVHVGEHRHETRLRNHRRAEGRAARALETENVGRPFFEKMSVGGRRTEHFGDEDDGERMRDFVDEIEPTAGDGGGDHGLGELADAGLEGVDGFRRERLLHEGAHARVIRGIGADYIFLGEVVAERAELLTLVIGETGEEQALAIFVGEVFFVFERNGDVVEATHDPSLPLIAPEHGRFVAQLAINRIRIDHHRRGNQQLIERRVGADAAGFLEKHAF